MKKLLVILGLLLASPSFAADNSVIVTPGVGVTMRSKDVGSGVESMIHILGDTTGNPIYGTAGTANANILTVQGIASMTPFLTNPGTAALWGVGATAAAVPANAHYIGINTGGNLVGWTGAVTAASGGIASGAMVDLGAQADAACGTDNGSCSAIALIKRGNQNLTTINTTAAAAVPAGTNRIGYVSDDPCSQKIKLNAPFSTSSGGPVSIVALSGSTVIYVCSISAITDTAVKLSFIDGTGGSCASAQHAIWGSTTAASGMSLAANGGFTMGSGNGSVGVTASASAFCLLQSGTSLIAGNITYVQQ